MIVLRVLGHRWPRGFQAGEPVPPWADSDGIIPLTPIVGETSLAERLRDRLRDEDGDRGAEQVEALLLELTGQTLEEWLRRTFFSRHVRQFKHRPIAWHLTSTPSKEASRRARSSASPLSSACSTTTRAVGTREPACALTTSSRSFVSKPRPPPTPAAVETRPPLHTPLPACTSLRSSPGGCARLRICLRLRRSRSSSGR